MREYIMVLISLIIGDTEHLSAGCFFWEMSGLSPLHLEVSRYSLAVKIYHVHRGQNLLSTERNNKLHPPDQVQPAVCLV